MDMLFRFFPLPGASEADSGFDVFHDGLDRLVLPIAEHGPAVLRQDTCGFQIPFDVASEFAGPERRIVLDHLRMQRTPVPEAPIEEYCELQPGEDEIGSASKPRNRGEIDPIPEPIGMQTLPDRQLETGVPAAVGLHRPPDAVSTAPHRSSLTVLPWACFFM